MTPIRVLIVDDSATVRRILRTIIAEDPELQVAGVAANGRIALAMLQQNVPDVITLDIEMPEMDGLATLVKLREEHPRLPVIMFSTLTERGAVATLEALAGGATDYVTKPTMVGDAAQAIRSIREQLVPRIKALCERPKIAGEGRAMACGSAGTLLHSGDRIEVVALGTSTGGPNALADVLAAIPKDFPVPVVIVQHMPPTFTRFLAERLSRICGIPVNEATGTETLRPGMAWIAPGDRHLALARRGTVVQLELLLSPPQNSCRPSVDVLFESVALAFGRKVLGVVMTGMGQDGLRGAREIATAGGRVWAQDERTSVVWGMPGFVVQQGLAQRVLPVSMIGPEIVRSVMSSRGAATASAGQV
jgi:two-component system chemotaxis response regulator CheB